MPRSERIRGRICKSVPSLLSLAIAAAVAAPAAAQDVETVVVTGSYIRRTSQFDSPSPLVTTTSDDIAATGADTVLAGDLGCLLNIAGRLERAIIEHLSPWAAVSDAATSVPM